MRYDEKCLGKYFVKNGEIYECISYCSFPTLGFINLKTREKQSWANCSEIIKGFKQLVEVQDD